MTSAELFAFVKEGGAYCAVLLLLAVLWLDRERRRLLTSLAHKDEIIKAKDAKIESLAERVITVATAIDRFLFAKGTG